MKHLLNTCVTSLRRAVDRLRFKSTGFKSTVQPADDAPEPPIGAARKNGKASQSSKLSADFPRDISKEDIAKLPIRRYQGEVFMVATPEALALAMADIRQESVVGFDTETRPAFNKGEHHLPCLAQIATARAVYLFQLQRLDCAEALAELIDAPSIRKAGVALAHDLRELALLYPLAPAAVFDAGLVARRHGIKQTGLRNLAGLFLGFRIAKGQRTSNWATPDLSAAQIGYAATDAWVSRELYLSLMQLGLVEPAQT